ncbi:MAG: AAA family ATPase, partial [Pseudomonadota bacterium]
MAKSTTQYVCQSCGATYRKWAGRCESCGEWNSIVEDAGLSEAGPSTKSLGASKGRRIELSALDGEDKPPPRRSTGVIELDRVLGGGLVPASAVLLGGDPGIGKSTLLLQAAAKVAIAGGGVVYVSGEEAPAQLRMRASRLGLDKAPVKLAAATNLRDVLTTLEAEKPDLVIIDSV